MNGKKVVKSIFRKLFPHFFRKIEIQEPLIINMDDDDIEKYIIYGYPITKKIGPILIEEKSLEEIEKETRELEKKLREIVKELSPLRATFGPLVFKLKEEFDINKDIAINLGSLLGEYQSQLMHKNEFIKLIDPRIIEISEAFIDRYLLKRPNIPEITEPVQIIPLIDELDHEKIEIPKDIIEDENTNKKD